MIKRYTTIDYDAIFLIYVKEEYSSFVGNNLAVGRRYFGFPASASALSDEYAFSDYAP